MSEQLLSTTVRGLIDQLLSVGLKIPDQEIKIIFKSDGTNRRTGAYIKAEVEYEYEFSWRAKLYATIGSFVTMSPAGADLSILWFDIDVDVSQHNEILMYVMKGQNVVITINYNDNIVSDPIITPVTPI